MRQKNRQDKVMKLIALSRPQHEALQRISRTHGIAGASVIREGIALALALPQYAPLDSPAATANHAAQNEVI